MSRRTTLARAMAALGLVTTGLVATTEAPVSAGVAAVGPLFSTSFDANTIGPGSTSTLTFTIDNTANGPREQLAFTDTLPGAVTIADPANASTTCTAMRGGSGPTLTAPANGSTISFSDAAVGGGTTCFVTVDVTSSTIGTHTNTPSQLTSTASPSAAAPRDLEVDGELPGFTMAFSPSTVPLGDRSTLTFTIDNSLNSDPVNNLDFTDALPTGIEIADPASASTTCGTSVLPAALTASPGTTTITLNADGAGAFPALAPGATCTVDVDVVTTAGGTHAASVELLADFVSAGNATAALEVTTTSLALRQEFTDDPVLPGESVELVFTIFNADRRNDVSGFGFVDGLPAGVILASETSNSCGSGTSGVGGSFITVSGGSVAAGASCTIVLSLDVPAATPSGAYLNSTNQISTVGGLTGNAASDTLFIDVAPQLTLDIVEDTVGAGGDLTFRYTIDNPSTTEAMTDIEFLDELTDGSSGSPADSTSGFLPFPLSSTFTPVPDPPCGPGSSLSTSFPGVDRQVLSLADGSIAAGGSCSFDVTLSVPAGFAGGSYVNHTEEISGTVDGTQATGAATSDDVVIVAPPRLTKEFTGGPFVPGDEANLRFTLSRQGEGTPDATAIAFTDDLDAALTGLTATAIAASTCTGATVDISSPSTIDVSGASLTAGASCTIDVTLQIPSGATDATYTNTTSPVTATVLGATATGNAASADLTVSSLVLTKEYLENPYIAGAAGTLRYTVENLSGTSTDITLFTDDLNQALAGLTATGGATVNTCGGALSGTSFIIYVSGTVAANSTCVIEVPIAVPAGAADGTYRGSTSTVTHSKGTSPSAAADLVVDSAVLQITTEFTDDPVVPGQNVTVEFELTNLSATEAITDIAFSDDLDAALTGFAATATVTDTCGGTVTSAYPAGLFAYDGGTLTAGASCAITVTASVPAGPLGGDAFLNTTSTVSGLVGALSVSGSAASDTLAVQLQNVTMAFDAPTGATGTAELTFTITNLDPTNPATGLRLSTDLDAVIPGLVATSLPAMPCGDRSMITGTSVLALTGGSLAAGDSCTFTVTVLVPASATPGTYPVASGPLTADGLPVADAATASLVIEPPPAFATSFTPDSIPTAGTSTATFSIDNSANTVAATGFAFTDNLPAGVVVATPPNASATCTGGTVTAVAGSGTISVTSMTVGASATCTVSVDVSAAADGGYVNTTGDLTSSLGNSGSASDTLTVTLRTPPTVTIDQAAGQADPAGSAPIEFTVVFDEAVTGFDTADVSVVNGTVASVTPSGADTYTVAVTPVADGLVSATVDAGGAVDGEGTGNLASTSTDNTVNYDSTLPVINAPDITVDNDLGQAGAIVTYTVTTTDEGATTSTVAAGLLADGVAAPIVQAGNLTCAPASGTFFALGTTTVNCAATDDAGNTATAMFDVLVEDVEDPVITAVADVQQTSVVGASTTVDFATPAATDNSGSATVTCAPASGSSFGIGITPVICTAADAAGNTAATTFDVTVLSNSVLPATGGGLDWFTMALQFLLAGAGLLAVSRLRGRKRLAH